MGKMEEPILGAQNKVSGYNSISHLNQTPTLSMVRFGYNMDTKKEMCIAEIGLCVQYLLCIRVICEVKKMAL